MTKLLIIALVILAIPALTHAQKRERPALKDVAPICQGYITAKKFAPADTIFWETRVLPEFESVLKNGQFKKAAKENLNYKMALAQVGLDQRRIEARNIQRIVSEASAAGFDHAYSTRLHCSRNFITTVLPHAVDSFIACLKKENRDHGCGADFQTPEGIQKNLDVIKKIDKQFNALLIEAYRDPISGAFLEDVTNAYEEFSLQVNYAMERGQKEIAKAKAEQLKAFQNQYAVDTQKFKELRQAEQIFGRCKGYLKKSGFDDDRDKNIINQITHCELPGTGQEQGLFNQQMKSIEKIGEKMQRQSMVELGQKLLVETEYQTRKAYLMGYYRIHGRLPKEELFNAKTGESLLRSSAYSDARFEINSTPRMDIDGEISIFNTQVKELNEACAIYKTNKIGTSGERVNQLWRKISQKTALGNLLAIKSFKDKLGSFDEQECKNNGAGLKLLQRADKTKVVEALESTLDVLAKKGLELRKNVRKLTDPADPHKGIRYFLRYNPLIVNKVIAGNIDASQAALLCFETKKLYQNEKDDEFWNSALSYASIGGALVATVISGGAAAPLLVLSVTAGSLNSLNAINQAAIAEQNYQASIIDGSGHREVSMGQAEKYDMKGKMETVGLAMNFVPGVAGAIAKETKIFTTPLMKSSMATFVKNSHAWTTGTRMTKPVGIFLAKVGSGAGATMGELEAALASRIGPKTAQSAVTSLHQFAAGIPQDAALQFGTMALAYPDPPGPYSEEGLIDLMYGTAMGRGMAMVPVKFRNYQFQKKYKTNLNQAESHFNNLEANQKVAFENFKKEINFDKLPKDKQEEILLRMFEVHKGNNVAVGEKVSFGKVMDLAHFKQELIGLGVSSKVADTQIRNLASEENKVLGQVSNLKNATFTYLKDAFPRPLHPKEYAYYKFVLENDARLKQPIQKQKETSMERLAQMHKNTSSKDMQYLVDNEKVKPDFSGGEGDIYINPNNSGEALKIWKGSRQKTFDLSLKALSHYEQRIVENKILSNYLTVSKIKEKGRDFIVKEFSPRSVELKQMVQDPMVSANIEKVKQELLKNPDILNQKMYQALSRKPPSANFHWDPDQNKILLIDALGF